MHTALKPHCLLVHSLLTSLCRHSKDIDNRRLLWHGTSVAVVAAILKSGLRIMPHSGGRVGRGIYLASEHSKSAGYGACVRERVAVGAWARMTYLLGHGCISSADVVHLNSCRVSFFAVGSVTVGKQQLGIMFLVEAALGKEHHIKRDDSSLKAPPKGFDSVVAQGQEDPDPKKNVTIKIDGKPVVVPQGEPVRRAEYSSSSFGQTEWLVYQESQARLRYLLTFDLSWN